MPIGHRRHKSYFKEPDFKIGSRHRDFTPDKIGFNPETDGAANVDTRALRQALLVGDKDAVYYCDPNEPKSTTMKKSFKGLQVGDKSRASILDY